MPLDRICLRSRPGSGPHPRGSFRTLDELATVYYELALSGKWERNPALYRAVTAFLYRVVWDKYFCEEGGCEIMYHILSFIFSGRS